MKNVAIRFAAAAVLAAGALQAVAAAPTSPVAPQVAGPTSGPGIPGPLCPYGGCDNPRTK